MLHRRDGMATVEPSQQGQLQPVGAGQDVGQHLRQQQGEGVHIALAVFENRLPLVGGVSPAQDQTDHVRFLGDRDTAQTVGHHGPDQSFATRHLDVGRGAPKLGLEVQDRLGQGPPERQVTAGLGAGVVGDEQRSPIGGVGRDGPEVRPPQPDHLIGAQLAGHQTDGVGSIAGGAAVLEVDAPQLPELRRASHHPTAQTIEQRVIEILHHPAALEGHAEDLVHGVRGPLRIR